VTNPQDNKINAQRSMLRRKTMGYNMQSDRCLGNASSQQHCAPGVVREDKNESDSSGFLIRPNGINPEGAITGQYGAMGQSQGFLRTPGGTFITFNPPNSTYTNPVGINPEGAITGWSMDASRVTHGFLRTRDGTLITIDAPGAGTGSFEGTVAVGINAEGTITGNYFDANFNSHGFLRTRAGNFTTFDPPGSNGNTFPSGINDAGAVTGGYADASNVFHGFLRKP
jgi:hypothetical protein